MDEINDNTLEDDSSRPLLADEAASYSSSTRNLREKISRPEFYASLPALVMG